MNLNDMEYDNLNKLHLLLGGENSALTKAREVFMSDLKKAQSKEKEHCARTGGSAVMTSAVFNNVADVASQCTTFFEVEALARYVFDDNFLPTYAEVKTRAVNLEKIMPVYDTLTQSGNPLRSF